jgi:hypothetical protein
MKRDLDLVRKLLIYFEEKPDPKVTENLQIEGYDDLVVQYHLNLMYDARLLNCEAVCSSTTPGRIIEVLPFDLTWEGHEFLSKVRNEGVWQRIKSTITTRGGSLAFSVVNELATKFALAAVKDG